MTENISEQDLFIIEEQQELPDWMVIPADYEPIRTGSMAERPLMFD